MKYYVEKSSLAGSIAVTSSKSHTMRAVLLASMATGTSHLRRLLPSPDTEAMLAACTALGAKMENTGNDLVVEGTSAKLSTPRQVIDVGNSGQVLRFGAAMASLLPLYTIITGDASVCSIRPMQPLLDALTQLGAFAVSSKNDGHAPIIVRGPVKPGYVLMEGRDSQPVSAILMLAAFLKGSTVIEVKNAGEQPWIDLTLYWLDKIGIKYTNNNYNLYTVEGQGGCNSFDYTVPGDWSSAAFPVAAALITNSSVTLENMDINDPQGDKAVLGIFERMGARIAVDQTANTVTVHSRENLHGGLQGIDVDMNSAIDAVPIIATVACYAATQTRIRGAAIARHKESDRLSAISAELAKMGASIEEFEDGLTVYPTHLHGAVVESRHDHRIAMSLAVAGLACGDVIVESTDCVAKSFPGFASAMQGIGARIQEI